MVKFIESKNSMKEFENREVITRNILDNLVYFSLLTNRQHK